MRSSPVHILAAAVLVLPLSLPLGVHAATAEGTPDGGAGTAVHPNGQGAVGEPLQPGANSFTEAQVKERFAKMGFGEVTDLTKDDQGIWRGRANHAGRQLTIGMDYRGNVAAQ
ncbi:hypothetical protein [Methylobacterium sp. A54F]